MMPKPSDLAFRCPTCGRANRSRVSDTSDRLECAHCGWSRVFGMGEPDGRRPAACLVCGCHDLWRQKNFPQRLGLLAVALAAVLSTIAVAVHRPVAAFAILMAFALADLLLYLFMPDVLVCYRCGARHRQANLDHEFPRFNLELHERYRQEAKRLEERG